MSESTEWLMFWAVLLAFALWVRLAKPVALERLANVRVGGVILGLIFGGMLGVLMSARGDDKGCK